MGALVQITDHPGGGAVYLPARDANGNITALIDAGATAPGANPVAASYEYSPFGELVLVAHFPRPTARGASAGIPHCDS